MAIAAPVLHLQPGDVLETNTVDADGHALEDAGMKVAGTQSADWTFLH